MRDFIEKTRQHFRIDTSNAQNGFTKVEYGIVNWIAAEAAAIATATQKERTSKIDPNIR